MTPILTFNGDPALKDFYLNLATPYWDAKDSFIHSFSHDELACLIGIPVQLSRLIYTLLEEIPASEAKTCQVRFIEALSPGVDMQPALDRYLHCLLSDPTHGTIAFANPSIKSSIQAVVDLYARRLAGDEPSVIEWAEAWAAAEAAEAAASEVATRASEAAWVTEETVSFVSGAASWASCAAARAAARAAYWAASGVAARASEAAASAASCAAASAEWAVRVQEEVEPTIAACAAQKEHYSWQANILLTSLESLPRPKANKGLV